MSILPTQMGPLYCINELRSGLKFIQRPGRRLANLRILNNLKKPTLVPIGVPCAPLVLLKQLFMLPFEVNSGLLRFAEK